MRPIHVSYVTCTMCTYFLHRLSVISPRRIMSGSTPFHNMVSAEGGKSIAIIATIQYCQKAWMHPLCPCQTLLAPYPLDEGPSAPLLHYKAKIVDVCVHYCWVRNYLRDHSQSRPEYHLLKLLNINTATNISTTYRPREGQSGSHLYGGQSNRHDQSIDKSTKTSRSGSRLFCKSRLVFRLSGIDTQAAP